MTNVWRRTSVDGNPYGCSASPTNPLQYTTCDYNAVACNKVGYVPRGWGLVEAFEQAFCVHCVSNSNRIIICSVISLLYSFCRVCIPCSVFDMCCVYFVLVHLSAVSFS